MQGGNRKKEKIRPVGRIRMPLEQEAGTLTRIFRLNGGRADVCATSACDGAGDGNRTRVIGLGSRSSATELRLRILMFWLGRLGSDQRISDSESDALPLGYTPIGAVGFVSAPTMPIATFADPRPRSSLPRFSSTSARLPYPTHPRKCPGSRNRLRLDVNSLGSSTPSGPSASD